MCFQKFLLTAMAFILLSSVTFGMEIGGEETNFSIEQPENPFPDHTENGKDYLNVPYWNTAGDPDRQVLDLYLPDSDGPYPVVLFFHGGGFLYGDKEDQYNADFHNYLNSKGVGYALANYRYSTEIPFKLDDPVSTPYPVSMWDGARALQTLRYWSDYLDIDPDKIALMGRSAGAGIVQWIAFHDDIADPLSPDLIQRVSTRVSCVSPLRGQTTYDPREIQQLFPAGYPRDLSLDIGVMSLYGLDPQEYNKNREYYDEIYAPSYREASPSEHVDESDTVFVIAYYNYEFDDGIDNIHDPEFMAYMAWGDPGFLVQLMNTNPYDSVATVRYAFEWAIPLGGLVERYPDIADIMISPGGCNLNCNPRNDF